ncbi:hypothetical protein [Mucilaginibacter boryungensis]|uniref:Lipoprotein n=1 Tax=Mucilaginibacter boryungensis TaxID=768480 RepID=A0ABR9XMP7_9SPHI|nr:hypothetical protein [Mucilaginibacter boryungensis]MBE9668646.1 hypothetical protein [Mucilaginibacter boryungensis]
MKKLQILFLALSLSLIAASCNWGRHNTISIHDGQNSIRVEYTGRIGFAEDNKAVVDMSPNGYLKFRKNDEELNVERNKAGQIMYEVNDERANPVLNEDGQRLLAEAIKMILKAQGRRVSRRG